MSVSFNQLNVSLNENGYIDARSDELISSRGVLMSDKFTNFFIQKIKDGYKYDEEVSKVVDKRLAKLTHVFIQTLDGDDAYFDFKKESYGITVARKYFHGFKVGKNRELIPVLKMESIAEFLNAVGHECEHVCAFHEKKKYNRNGIVIGKERFLGVNKEQVNHKTGDGKYSINCHAMEGINCVITAKDCGDNSLSYYTAMLGTFALPFLMGYENLKTSMVMNPEDIINVVNNLSGHKDWLGKVDLLSRIATNYEKQLGSLEESKIDEFLGKKIDEICSLVGRMVVADLLIPNVSTQSVPVLKKDEFFRFISSSQRSFAYQVDELMMYSAILSDENDFKEFKAQIYRDYERIVGKNKTIAKEVIYDGLIPNSKTPGDVYSAVMSREIIGVREFASMNKETQKAYQDYVKSVCEELGEKVEFDTNVVMSRTGRYTGRFIPDEVGMKDVCMFEYVASKLGYKVDNIKTHPSSKTTTCTVEKLPQNEQADQESFEIFQGLVRDSYQYFAGKSYLYNLELEEC